MIAILIIGTLLSAAMLVYRAVLINNDDVRIGVPFVILGIILTGVGVGSTMTEIISIPKAIDVYRGKTTLEITYRDSVAIDSTVVYKMK